MLSKVGTMSVLCVLDAFSRCQGEGKGMNHLINQAPQDQISGDQNHCTGGGQNHAGGGLAS